MQDKDRAIQEVEQDKNEEIEKFRQDNTEMHERINHLTYLTNKLKNEIAEKDNMLGRVNSMSSQEGDSYKQQLEVKKQENHSLHSQLRELRQAMKEREGEFERKRRDLAERNSILETEARKYRSEYEQICNALKSKINNTIDTVSYRK